MECSIEYSHLRNCRKNLCNSLDTKEIGRIMKRCEYRTFLELGNYLVRNELAAYELFCTMNNSVTHSLDVLESSKNAEFFIKKSIHDRSDTYCMVLDRHFLYELLLSGRLMLEAACFHSDPLDKTLGKEIINLIILHIKELILE